MPILLQSCTTLLVTVILVTFPLKVTVAPLTKFDPFTVRVNAPEFTVAEEGCSEVSTGTGLLATSLMAKARLFEVPPPGAGLVTVTSAEPVLTISSARMVAVTCVELTNVVARALPLKFTTAPETKPVPFTVRVQD